MKKKLKDLTFGECMKICKNRRNCYECPLFCNNDFRYNCYLLQFPNFNSLELETEVEVDE